MVHIYRDILGLSSLFLQDQEYIRSHLKLITIIQYEMEKKPQYFYVRSHRLGMLGFVIRVCLVVYMSYCMIMSAEE